MYIENLGQHQFFEISLFRLLAHAPSATTDRMLAHPPSPSPPLPQSAHRYSLLRLLSPYSVVLVELTLSLVSKLPRIGCDPRKPRSCARKVRLSVRRGAPRREESRRNTGESFPPPKWLLSRDSICARESVRPMTI